MKIKLSLSMLAAMAVLSGFCSIRAVTPTNWNGKADSWQMVRHQAKLAEIEKTGGAPIVFIGDSITHGWEWSGTPVWKKYFAEGKYRALNLGTSADRTEHVLWRITEGKELDGYEAKVVVLMIGTNNTGHFPFDKEPPVDTFFGIKTIVDTI
jgi:lysophospholipase L1-like esterase